MNLLAALAVLIGSSTAGAQDASLAAECRALNADLPPTLSGWLGRDTLVAASKPTELSKAALTVGTGVTGVLKLSPDVIYSVPSEQRGGPVTYGGLFALTIRQAGTYQVSLGSEALIELIAGETALRASTHAPGPACSTLRETLEFQLKPGRYIIQVLDNRERILPIMVTRLSPPKRG